MSHHEPRRVCVALDGSPMSRSALKWALSDILKPEDRLHLLTVIPASVAHDLVTGAGRHPSIIPSDCQPDERSLEGAKELLAASTQEAVRSGVSARRGCRRQVCDKAAQGAGRGRLGMPHPRNESMHSAHGALHLARCPRKAWTARCWCPAWASRQGRSRARW